MKTLRLLIAAMLAAALARPAECQVGLKSAGATTSLISRDFSTLNVEAKETSITLLLESGVWGLPTTWHNNFRVSLSAEDGERDLFSGGHWVPGLELENRFARVWENASGYTAAFVSLGYEVNGNSLARSGGGSLIETYDRTGHKGELGLGFNWAPREEGPVFGFSATGGRGIDVPVARRTSQVCIQQASGTDEDGAPVLVSRCKSRYLGEVHDTWTGEFRVDVQSPYFMVPLGGGSDEARRLTRQIRSELKLSPSASHDSMSKLITAEETRISDSMQSLEAETRRRREGLEQARRTGTPEEVAGAQRAFASAEEREKQARVSLERVRGLRGRLSRSLELTSDRPTASLLASASAETADGAKPIYSVAAGPMLHPPFTPLKVVAGVLFELDDLTNATGEAPDWNDRFAIRLYIGVPF